MDFGKLFNDNLLELDDLQMENSKNKINLIRRSNLQRNLARITFQKTIELNNSPEATCHLLDTDVKIFEHLVHRSGKEVSGQRVPNDHLLMTDCLEMLDKNYKDDSYKTLQMKTWANSLSVEDQIQKYGLPCRHPFLGCTDENLFEAENCISIDNDYFKNFTQTNHPAILDNDEDPTRSSRNNVFSIFKPNPKVTLTGPEQHKNIIEPKPGSSGVHAFNKWTIYKNDQPDCIQREEVSNSQAQISFTSNPFLKRRIKTTDAVEGIQNSEQNSFHTGTEVLQQQQNLRNGGRSVLETTSVALSNKKSLGGRRNVQSKFVPPFLPQTTLQLNDDSSSYSSDVDMIDDRLKHVDPKMVELIRSEIMDTGSTHVTWTDIAGLEYAKSTIKEAVVWPLLRPDIFTGLRRPPRGILLFGPPGTGKTLIGKCIASKSKSTFFSISASSLTSKWIGDGEKMVRALFAVAAVHQPAVIFIDEIDSLLCQRSENEHESSRRLKTEFLIQLDGAATADDERILIVGATNRPQELDEAARRRLVKRLYIPLPELSARQTILRNLLKNERTSITIQQIDEIAKLSCGFSGADMKTLCHEASMGPIRSIEMDQMEYIDLRDVRSVCYADFETALRRVRSSVSLKDLDQYLAWDRTYGSGVDEK